MSAFRLADAGICHEHDCETVFSLREARSCPTCGSGEYSPVAAFLTARQGRAYTQRVTEELVRLRACRLVALKRTGSPSRTGGHVYGNAE